MNSPRRLLLIPRTYQVLRILITAILCISAWHSALASEMQEESRIKFAIYSPAWGGNTQDDLRLVAHNTMTEAIKLDSIIFLKPQFPESEVELTLGMRVPATGYADLNIGYVNLLLDNKCINRTLSNKWRLAEISNYTLNPRSEILSLKTQSLSVSISARSRFKCVGLLWKPILTMCMRNGYCFISRAAVNLNLPIIHIVVSDLQAIPY